MSTPNLQKVGENQEMPNMYCPICEKKHFVVIRIKFEKFDYKGKQLQYKKRMYVCKESPKANRIFVDGDIITKNLVNMRKAIKESCL